MVKYLQIKIAEKRLAPPRQGAGMTRDGYTVRRGAPSRYMIRLEGEKRWRRLMVWQFSNAGTCFIRVNGEPLVVNEFDLPS